VSGVVVKFSMAERCACVFLFRDLDFLMFDVGVCAFAFCFLGGRNFLFLPTLFLFVLCCFDLLE